MFQLPTVRVVDENSKKIDSATCYAQIWIISCHFHHGVSINLLINHYHNRKLSKWFDYVNLGEK